MAHLSVPEVVSDSWVVGELAAVELSAELVAASVALVAAASAAEARPGVAALSETAAELVAEVAL